MLSALRTADGSLAQQKRVGKPDRYYASPISDGHSVLLAGVSGQLNLVSAEANWKPLAQVELGEELWSTPASAGGYLYVRTQSALWCLGPEPLALEAD